MTTRSYEVGQVARAVSCTRISNHPGGKQTVNLFQQQDDQSSKKIRAPATSSVFLDESENAPPSNTIEANPDKSVSEKPIPKKTRCAVPPGGKSQFTLTHAEFTPTQTTSNFKPKSNIFSEGYATLPIRSSTRIHAAPHAGTAMANVFNHEQQDTMPRNKTNPDQQKSKIFEDDPAPFKSSTKRILAPGGQSSFSFVDDSTGQDQQHSFHTGRANESKNIFDLSPPDKSRRPVNPLRNKSSNVINLTPKAQSRTLPRPAKALEASLLTEQPKPVCASKYATHNKMMHSDIFSGAPIESSQRSSVRLHQPAGGNSSNIFS